VGSAAAARLARRGHSRRGHALSRALRAAAPGLGHLDLRADAMQESHSTCTAGSSSSPPTSRRPSWTATPEPWGTSLWLGPFPSHCRAGARGRVAAAHRPAATVSHAAARSSSPSSSPSNQQPELQHSINILYIMQHIAGLRHRRGRPFGRPGSRLPPCRPALRNSPALSSTPQGGLDARPHAVAPVAGTPGDRQALNTRNDQVLPQSCCMQCGRQALSFAVR